MDDKILDWSKFKGVAERKKMWTKSEIFLSQGG